MGTRIRKESNRKSGGNQVRSLACCSETKEIESSGEKLLTFIYPGSFDPITNGHLDIIDRATQLCDRLIVAIAINSSKTPLFNTGERLDMLTEVIGDRKKIEVTSFEGLLVDYAQATGARAVVRGLRAVTDFDYEYAMNQINGDMAPEVETVFLLASKEYSFLSSTMIKEVARYGKTNTLHAPEQINQALLRKFGHIQ